MFTPQVSLYIQLLYHDYLSMTSLYRKGKRWIGVFIPPWTECTHGSSNTGCYLEQHPKYVGATWCLRITKSTVMPWLKKRNLTFTLAWGGNLFQFVYELLGGKHFWIRFDWSASFLLCDCALRHQAGWGSWHRSICTLLQEPKEKQLSGRYKQKWGFSLWCRVRENSDSAGYHQELLLRL